MGDGEIDSTYTPDFNPGTEGLSLGGGDQGYSLSSVGPYSPERGGYSFAPGSWGETAGQAGGPGSGGGSGWDKFASGLGKEFSDNPIKSFAGLLGIGATGLNIGNQFRLGSQLRASEKSVADAQARAREAAAPAVAAGTANLQRGEAGKLQPAMEARLQDAEQRAMADVKARFASMGIANSSQEQEAVNRVRLEYQGIRAQLLQGEEQLGGQLIGTGVNAAVGGAQVAGEQEKLLASLIASANQSLGILGGRAS